MNERIPQTDYVYDIETYFDHFCCDITHVATGNRWIFEVNDRVNQSAVFVRSLAHLGKIGARMFGFNNEGFDWPVCQAMMDIYTAQGYFTAYDAYLKAQKIIDSQDRFAHTLWPNERKVTQGDLYKIHHFDNFSKSTSLKKLEINMRMNRIVDLPYDPHKPMTPAQRREVTSYMCHDVEATKRFWLASLDQILFRDDLAVKYPDLGDVLNFNDTKIGKKFFERELERKVPGSCFTKVDNRRVPRQTRRDQIAIADVLSPKVSFFHPEFQRVYNWLSQQVLTKNQTEESLKQSVVNTDSEELVQTKGIFKDLSATVEGFKFDFGTGGIHGSLHKTSVYPDDDHDLIDVDVASFYPNLAITNGFFPKHLSEEFCSIYKEVFDMRRSYGKKTAENAMLKLALNGVYGDSNNKYSPFYDPQYTMAITINGQLLLCMLAERVMFDAGAEMVQINTDGLTVRVRKDMRDQFMTICKSWEDHTGLELEYADYSAMHIRDVNSYLAVKTDGSVKRIGAYAYETVLENPYTRERQWHQDHSMLVVRKAAEAVLVRGEDVSEFIMMHRDPFDFMLSTKVNRSSRLYCGDQQVQGTTRYYMSTDGAHLTKIMPPLKGKTEERSFAVRKGWTVTPVNDAADFRWDNVNWLYYIEEAKALLI